MGQVYELVGLTELYYAGSHGMDIMTPVNLNGSPEDPNCIKSTDQQISVVCHVNNDKRCLLRLVHQSVDTPPTNTLLFVVIFILDNDDE
ncbi:unnamed protein product [Arabis nemorensis]|uniref:Trehalose-phosphatase n=1 Tax=Arabis nemorensis TaxID=586526 RepID=A0A565BAF9_9BRAS|nr:unnamed protein product [Arabis nemorensis]